MWSPENYRTLTVIEAVRTNELDTVYLSNEENDK